MPRMRIEARVQYRDGGVRTTRNTMIFSIAPGDSTSDWQTEKVRSVDDLRKLLETANAKKKITFLMEPHYALMVFKNQRDIDFLSLLFQEWGQPGGTLMNATCKDLSVIKNMPAPAGSLPDLDVSNPQIVTLQFSGRFST